MKIEMSSAGIKLSTRVRQGQQREKYKVGETKR